MVDPLGSDSHLILLHPVQLSANSTCVWHTQPTHPRPINEMQWQRHSKMKHGYDAPSSSSSSSCIMCINIVLSVVLTSTSLVLSRAASLLSLETIHSVQQQRRNLQLIGNNHKQINCTHHELSQTTTRATHKHYNSICLFSSSTKVQVNWTNNCNFYQHAFQWSLLAVDVYLRLDWTTLKAGQKRLWITLFPQCVYLQFTNHPPTIPPIRCQHTWPYARTTGQFLMSIS